MAINYYSSIDLLQNQLIKPRIQNETSDANAGSGVDGQIYFNTTSNTLKVWITSAWYAVPSAGTGYVNTVDTANSTFVNLVDSGTAADPILTASLSATGAPSGTTYLRGDNTWATITDQYVGTVTSVNTANSFFISGSGGPITTSGSLTYSLSATGTPTSSTYLRGDNTWAALPSLYTGWTLAGNSGASQVIGDGDTASILGTGVITTEASATDTITITHSNVTRTDTTSTASPAFGATFTAVDSVTSSAQGHVTAINLKTVTLPTTPPDTDTTYTLPVSAGGANTAVINLTAGGSGSGIASSVTFSGTTNEIEVTETTGNNGTITIGLPNNVTVTGALTVSGAAQSSFGGQVTIPQTPAADTDAASKHYVDQSNIGQSVFQGGYNAATNVPDLDVAPSSTIKKGWFWAVTNKGTFFAEVVQPGDLIYANIDNPGATFANWTVVQSGQDIAGEGASDGATTKGIAGFNSAHFSVTANGWVSSDIYAGGSNLGIVPSGGAGTTFLRGDGTWVTPSGTYVLPVATATTLGGVELFSNTVQTIAANAVSATASRSYGVQVNAAGQMVVNVPWVDTNSVTSVSPSAVNNRLGLAITPTSGAVVAGLSIDALADITTGSDAADSLPIYDVSTTTNKRITLNNLTAKINAATSFTNTGPATAGTSYTIAAVTHGLGSDSSVIMVQLVLVATGETVYADVTRGASGLITITFDASQAINTFRALLQKIG
jgi:hypothetical protein